MNRAQKLLVSTVSRLVPDFRRLMESAGGSLRVADRLLAARAAEASEGQRALERRKLEMREAYDLVGTGPEMRAIVAGSPVSVQEAYASKDTSLRESLWELELALEDRGWQRQLAIASLEYSRYGIQQLILMSRLYKLKNPLIKRGVTISAFYVFGRGVEITSSDEPTAEAIKAFLDDPNNARELGHTGLVQKHMSLQTDGNLFFIFFTDPGDGQVQVRTIDPTEIWDKITDPDDSSVDWYYRRSWTPVKFDPSAAQGYAPEARQDVWYPAVGFEPSERPQKIGNAPIQWDTPVLHRKVGAEPKWKFGCPEVYTAINDARAYADFLKDWCTIMRALSRFSWDMEQPGGQQAISAASNALSTTLGISATSIETNPPPTVAAAFVRSPGTKLTPIKTANSITGPEEARRILLMVAAAFGLPETFFGDASTGSLATAKSLDRPTELRFMQDQEFWRETITIIVTFALRQGVRGPKGKLREALRGRRPKFVGAKEAPKGTPKDSEEIPILVKFPAILEHDIAQMVTAIVQAGTLGGFDPAGTVPLKEMSMALMAEIGIDNPEEAFEGMHPSYDPKVGDGTGQPEQDAAFGAPAVQAHPRLPTHSFGAESAQMVKQLARYVIEHVNGR